MPRRRHFKTLRYLGVLLVLVLIFRGFLFRNLVIYNKIETRAAQELSDHTLLSDIEAKVKDQSLSINQIIDICHNITSESLRFSFGEVAYSPNGVLESNTANCIGYAALFNAIGEQIFEQQNLTAHYEFKHVVGSIEILGIDLHNYIKSPFFKDHDYVEIVDKNSGDSLFCDPSLRDYFRIDYVSSQ